MLLLPIPWAKLTYQINKLALYINVYRMGGGSIYPTPPCKQYSTQGLFLEWNVTDLNSEVFFSSTSCHTKVKQPRLPFITGERIVGCKTFPKGVSTMQNENSFVLNLKSNVRFHFQQR